MNKGFRAIVIPAVGAAAGLFAGPSRFRRYTTTGVGFAALVTLVLLATGWGSAAASSISSVLVTNTANNPIPVTPTGTVPVHEQSTAKVAEQNLDGNGNIKVHEQGTANVNVAGTPSVALASSGNTVKIDSNQNTVKIDSAGSGPISTQAADNPAFSPVARGALINFPDTDLASAVTVYTVPAGNELVIEQVSLFATLPLVEGSIFVQAGGHSAFFTVPLTVDGATGRDNSGDIQTRIYADPGSDVICEAELSQISPGRYANCNISGYLVPTS